MVQAVLLYGADSWTITTRNMDKLRSFHQRATRYMTGSHIWLRNDGVWEYPDHKELLEKCQLEEIEKYIERRRDTATTYIF